MFFRISWETINYRLTIIRLEIKMDTISGFFFDCYIIAFKVLF